MAQITFPALPKEERDQALGRYMDAFSRLERMMLMATQVMLNIEVDTLGPIFATLGTRQMIDLLGATAKLRLTTAGAERVKNLCDRIGRRNTRRNHIVHGYWTSYVTPIHGGYDGQWVRRYDHVDPTLMSLEPVDPKVLGFYNFTIPALDKATGHVEEMVQALSVLLLDTPQLLARRQTPEERLRSWVADRLAPSGGVALRLSQYRYP